MCESDYVHGVRPSAVTGVDQAEMAVLRGYRHAHNNPNTQWE